jgi:uncharacterized membrane protein
MMMGMNGGGMWIAMLVCWVVSAAVLIAVLVIAWRWMRAHERVADSLAGIERGMSVRRDPA